MTGQQLKNSILQEAIEGRLVSQDPNDEPASVLLERIRAEKARLVKEGKLKKRELIDMTIGAEEIPFAIPKNWVWCKLGDISRVLDIDHKMPSKVSNGIPYISPMDFYGENGINYKNAKKISLEDFELLSKKCLPEKGDIIFPRYGTIGVVRLIDSDVKFLVSYSCATIKIISNKLDSKYLYYLLQSPFIRIYEIEKYINKTTQPNVGLQSILKFLIPLPPLAEQHRIVEKIESLLPKVEAYGKAQEELEKLNEALPEQLKRSILQEAIEGRLVPQDPNDEPASVLLERIRTEKARLVKEKKIKKDKNESRIYRTEDGHWMEHFEDKSREDVCIDEDIPFDVPSGWEWCRLGIYANLYTGNSISKEEKIRKYTNVKGRWYIGTKDVGFDFSIDYENGIYIPEKDEINFKIAPLNSILMCIEGGSAGRKIGIVDRDVCFGNKLCCIYSYVNNNSFLYYYLQSQSFKDCFESNKKGIIGGVSINNLMPILIPLPPLAEQHRIVEKLEEILPKLNNLKKETEK